MNSFQETSEYFGFNQARKTCMSLYEQMSCFVHTQLRCSKYHFINTQDNKIEL